MGKYDILESIADKVKALDNLVKLKILALLIEEGSKSITAISKELNINFSTAHKYLEQLEAASLVTSKQVSENRLKRLFYISDFDVQLSPSGIANLISSSSKIPSKANTFKIINESGEFVDFDEKIFSQKYLKRGMPRGLVANALASVLERTYDGITVIELRDMFKDELNKRMENILDVTKQITIAEGHKRTYKTVMQFFHPEALKEHANGDIFIMNLDSPKLLDFVHDVRGIAIHGVNGKTPETMENLFEQILFAVDFVAKSADRYQSLDSFNYFIAPLSKNISDAALRSEMNKFFEELNKTSSRSYICLDIGLPDVLKNLPTTFWTKDGTTYENYEESADNVTKIVKDLFETKDYKNLRLLIKLWRKTNLSDLPINTYVANMMPSWQKPNAGFVGSVRLDPKWKNHIGTNRAGEAQEIVINVPRLALQSASFKDFLYKIDTMIRKCCDYIENMAELNHGEFLRKKQTQLKSTQRSRWSYISIEDCPYMISFTGVKNALDVFNKSGEKNIHEVFLKHCDKALSKRIKIPIRVLLKENVSQELANRFYHLDSKNHKVKPYVSGLGLDLKNLHLQSYLWGGYRHDVKKKDLEKLPKEFGLVKIVN